MFASSTINLIDDDEDFQESEMKTKTTTTSTSTTTTKTTPLECCICLSDLGKTNITALPCIHCFHTECIETALKTSSLCPLCKYDTKKDGFPQQQQESRVRQAIFPNGVVFLPIQISIPPTVPSFGFSAPAPPAPPAEAKEDEDGEDGEEHQHDHRGGYGPRRRHGGSVTYCKARIANGPKAGQICLRQRKQGYRFCGYHC
jgi:hypothetical protein